MNILNKYRTDGQGLHSFVDQTDKKQYLYSQFEVDNCHFVMPVFDQPDIRAAWTFRTIYPTDWVVISNENSRVYTQAEQSLLNSDLVSISKLYGIEFNPSTPAFKSAFFHETPKISTYLYAIVAGPYGFFEYKNVKGDGLPPMKIYARQSLMKSVLHEELFKATASGMNFYNDMFGRPYPFRKYDQIFVPEFNEGGMENVGAITYAEDLLFRDETVTMAKKTELLITVLHELAHMWFGDLVTMKWWNDLWLNESFATYMSYIALTEIKDLNQYSKYAWLDFLDTKFEGVSNDQLLSTHPICSDIKSTDQVESIFDGISYGKGASWIKQVHNVFGQDTLKSALHIYFDKYAWKNTELKDFIGSLQEAYEKSGDQSMG